MSDKRESLAKQGAERVTELERYKEEMAALYRQVDGERNDLRSELRQATERVNQQTQLINKLEGELKDARMLAFDMLSNIAQVRAFKNVETSEKQLMDFDNRYRALSARQACSCVPSGDVHKDECAKVVAERSRIASDRTAQECGVCAGLNWDHCGACGKKETTQVCNICLGTGKARTAQQEVYDCPCGAGTSNASQLTMCNSEKKS